MLLHASIPAIFGSALLDKYPNLVQDMEAMDEGMEYFLAGWPAMMPVKGVFAKHWGRRKVWEAVDGFQKALDGFVADEDGWEDGGEEADVWGDLGDVSELMLERNQLWRGMLIP